MAATKCTGFLFYFDQLSRTTNNALASIYIGMAVITSSVNLTLMVAMLRTNQAFSNTSNTLIICVSAIDALNGAISLPLYSYVRFTFEQLKSCTLTSAGQVIGMFLAYLSFSIVILMAIDRYLHMRTSLEARRSTIAKLFDGKWIVFPLIWAALFSIVAAVSYLVTIDWRSTGSIIAIGLISIAKLIIIPGIATLYITGYIRVRKFVCKNPVYSASASGIKSETEATQRTESIATKTTIATTTIARTTTKTSTVVIPRYLKNLQKTVLLLVVSLLFTYIPYNIAKLVHVTYFLSKKQAKSVLVFYDIANILFISSFTLNSLIIFKMNKKARGWVIRQIQRCTVLQ